MKQYLKSVALLLLLAGGTAVSAQDAEGVYVGLGVASARGEEQGISFTSQNIVVLGGYKINDYVAVEGEFSFTVAEDSLDLSGLGGGLVDVGLQHSGLFARANLMGDDAAFVPYVRAGWVNGKATASAGGLSASVDDTVFAYGVGGEFNYSEAASIRLDYTKADFDQTDASIVAVSTVFHF